MCLSRARLVTVSLRETVMKLYAALVKAQQICKEKRKMKIMEQKVKSRHLLVTHLRFRDNA